MNHFEPVGLKWQLESSFKFSPIDLQVCRIILSKRMAGGIAGPRLEESALLHSQQAPSKGLSKYHFKLAHILSVS